jgi:argininosuccinate lyase
MNGDERGSTLWHGRFAEGPAEALMAYTASIAFDRRLWRDDIAGSRAHVTGLAHVGLLTDAERDAVLAALDDVYTEMESGTFEFLPSDEDIHTAVERRVTELAGNAGAKLHTGRSRNDQVATDLRLWLREAIDQLSSRVRSTQEALLELAETKPAVVLPGYTHLQRAQPILFAHWCLAYFEMLARDRDRLREIRGRVNVLPLGSAALAGASFPIDREAVARELGFASISRNSVDAVSDRDFCVEFVSACSLVMVHLSRLAEEVILYSTSEFAFFELSDAVATGSSLMPQKKNPDSMELVRGKAGRVVGHLVSLLTMLKGLPLAYNKDMQEDKEAVFDAFDTTHSCLEVATLVLRNVKLNEERMRAAAAEGMMNATELADYLVRKGIPFREAHETVGRIVVKAIERGVEIGGLGLEELRSFSSVIENDMFEALTLGRTLASKSIAGGTAPARVAEALAVARKSLSS